MGYYINPVDMSKEAWLDLYGERLDDPPETSTAPGYHYVCVVDNGPFTAAGICYNDREQEAFSDPGDIRPKQWYSVPDAALCDVCPNFCAWLEANNAIGG